MKIYTKTGDNMMTSAVSKRVYKNDDVIECLGTIDEFQAYLMLSTHYLEKNNLKELLVGIVKKMFDVGADILKFKETPFISVDDVGELEKQIDFFEEKLPPIHDFVLPGKNIISSQIHVCRTICRRLERRVVDYGLKEELNPYLLQYINRLSDLLFVTARYLE